MNVHSCVGRALLLVVGLFACDEGAGREPSAVADGESVSDAPSAPESDAPFADASLVEMDASRTPDAVGATKRDAGGMSLPPDAAARAADAASASTDAAGGSAPEGGTPAVAPPRDVPAPVAAPLIWGFGLGVTDLPNALKFYTEVMKMTVEKETVARAGRSETILYASEAKRGARIVLMKFDDMRNTRKITTKLVFQSDDARAVNMAAAKFPDYVSRLSIGIVQFDGPETYVHELGGIFDRSGRGITVPYPIAMGFATSDLAASRRFYTAIGMDESRTGSFSVSDATGSGTITEYSVKFAMGSGLVLQAWSPMRNAKDNPIKVVLFVPDARALADAIVAAGGSIVEAAERTPVYDNRLAILAKDPDGYLLELVQ